MCLTLSSVLGTDYSLASSPLTVTFPVGSADGDITCVTIAVVDDDALEGNHSFSVHLTNPSSGVVIGSHTYAFAVIVDNGMP